MGNWLLRLRIHFCCAWVTWHYRRNMPAAAMVKHPIFRQYLRDLDAVIREGK